MNLIPSTENDLRAVCNELNLTIEKLNAAKHELKLWLQDQAHLPDQIDDRVLTTVALYSRKGLEGCKRRLDAYFTVRTMFPILYEFRDPQDDDLIGSGRVVAHGMCPGYTADHCRVYVAKLLDTDVNAFNFNALLRRLLLLQDLTMMLDVKAGAYLVADFSGVTVQHFLKLSITQARELMYCLQSIYPLRIKKMVFINVKPFCKTLLETMVMPLLKSKIANRTHFLSNTMNVGKQVPLDILPSDMGGNGPSSEEVNDFWTTKLLSYREWILTEGSVKSDESKREGTSPVQAPGCTLM